MRRLQQRIDTVVVDVWLKLLREMVNETQTKKFATRYQRTGDGSVRRINAVVDVLVPIGTWNGIEKNDIFYGHKPLIPRKPFAGVTLTVGCYAIGLKSMANSQYKLGQKMMYCRVAFQAMTFAAMFYEKFTAQMPKWNAVSFLLHPCFLCFFLFLFQYPFVTLFTRTRYFFFLNIHFNFTLNNKTLLVHVPPWIVRLSQIKIARTVECRLSALICDWDRSADNRFLRIIK